MADGRWSGGPWSHGPWASRPSDRQTVRLSGHRDELPEEGAGVVGVGAIVPRGRAAVVVAGRDRRVDDAGVALEELRSAGVAVAVTTEARGARVHEQAEPVRLQPHELGFRHAALAVVAEARDAGAAGRGAVADVDEDGRCERALGRQ